MVTVVIMCCAFYNSQSCRLHTSLSIAYLLHISTYYMLVMRKLFRYTICYLTCVLTFTLCVSTLF
ncbi:hypothetical protein HanIR_Chr09g0430211 [Helianthus annuus]|nr:hypothetical protein HanIR_Chr09g0430211 [Helianthus annuus]